jgi:sulfur-carrier protein adenylyltransferase/sulfurtransferase
MAAQMLAGKGFQKIFNLTGGINAWEKDVAVGPDDSGLYLFTQEAGPEETIITGFGLEMGLRDFYLSLQKRVANQATKKLFEKLADIEIKHQQRLVALYTEITGTAISITDFAEKIVEPAMEGGLTTEEYLNLYETDLDSELEVLSLALAIETQALDLYMRAAERSSQQRAGRVLRQIAEEERSHIASLGHAIDNLQVHA